ncbi:MAG: VacJ family lipoprotein [Gammaproteobacteria bacterium]
MSSHFGAGTGTCDAGIRWRRPFCLLVVLLSLALQGCASNGAKESDETYDPLEPLNRGIYKVNHTLDRFLLRPVAKGYDTVAPRFVKFAVMNFFRNLEQPIYVVNLVLQGKFAGATRQTGRFVINSTLGLGGIIDAAKDARLPREQEDFGQTLGVWGFGGGPYLMLPLFGPSNFRDGIGLLADAQIDPLLLYDNASVRDKLIILKIIDRRRQLLPADKAINEAADPYIFIREAYLQNRLYNIHDGNPPQDDLGDFEDEFDAEFDEEYGNPDLIEE